MSGPLDGAINYFEAGIYALQEELDGVLSAIAFDGKAKDLRYIYKKRGELKRKYDALITFLGNIGSLYEESPILLALDNIRSAYYGFIDPSWKEMSSGQREEEANDILGEHFFLTPEAIPLAAEISRLENKAFAERKELEIKGWSLWPDGEFELDYEFV